MSHPFVMLGFDTNAALIGPSDTTTRSSRFGGTAMRSSRASVGHQQLALGFGEEEMTVVHALDDTTEHGEVFTRRWIVELILDLVGYTPDRDLGALVLVEPSCGAGAFLIPVVERLIESCDRHGRPLSTCQRGPSGLRPSLGQRRTRAEGRDERSQRRRRRN